MRIPLTPYGRREVAAVSAGSIAATAACAGLAWALEAPALGAAALLPAAALAFTLQFFRDPERRADGVPPEAVLSPADGRVTDVAEVEERDFLGASAVRIGIFMSPFDCHVNRFPVSGRVAKVIHRAGRVLPAYDPRAIVENEASTTGILARFGDREVKVAVRQVAGIAARRIVNPLALGSAAARGERFGMIKFGSRCELFLPRDAPFEIDARVGMRARAGMTVLARWVGAGVAAGGAGAGGQEAGLAAGRAR